MEQFYLCRVSLHLDHHLVVHEDPRVLRTQRLNELVLIQEDLRQPDASHRSPESHALPIIADLGDL